MTAAPPGPPAPRAAGQITLDWLTWALRDARAISGTTVIASVTVEAIGDRGGVNGETHRVRVAYGRGDGPRSLIAKFAVERQGPRRTAAYQRWYEREVSFYATLAADSPIRTPRCYAASIDSDGDYVLLLEDLAPLPQGDQVAGCSVAQARTAIEAAARLHARWWNAAPPAGDALPETTVGLDRAARVQGALDRVWTRPRDLVALPAAVADRIPRLAEGYVPLLHGMASAPVTVVHGDYRLDNLFFGADGADGGDIVAIDWQFVCRCRGMYDIGYFIGLDLDPALRRAHERDLVAGYVAALQRHGVEGYALTEAWDDYRRALLLGFAVFLIGAAGEQPNDRMTLVHEVGLGRLAAALDDTEAFDVLDA
ncbi:MAG: hypothetical protein EXR64_05105 [Dehalococcoidia bacterium]|nr:hypothetical protein [Dehalococcoidia bacterium]